MPTLLTIQLFGDFSLRAGDTPITKLNTPRLQALLAYLILHRATPQARQQLAFLFWPDSNDAQARTNLRNALFQIRNALPDADDFLLVDTQTVQWRPDAPFTLDVADFAAALQSAEKNPHNPEARQLLERALNLYRGELLPGCYDDWVLPERERWQERYLGAQEQLINLLENQQEYRPAIQAAQRLLQLDPLRETTYARLMQLQALAGDRAAALRTYHSCATTMVRELGVEPGPATRSVYERLLNAETATPMATALRPASPLVGREAAWTQLQTSWQQASQGQPQLIVLAGEAGIGKTRLAEELINWAMRQGYRAAMAHCYGLGGQLAYAPVQEWLRAPVLQQARQELEPLWASEVARLLPELLQERPKLPPPSLLTESWQRQRLFEALARLLLQNNEPLLLVLDDLQWCDSDTLDWLQYLLRTYPQARILVVGTLRRAEPTTNAQVPTFLLNLTRTGQLTEIQLARLDGAATAMLAANLLGQPVVGALADQIYAETEGNPLFVVEMVRAEQRRGGESAAKAGSAPSDTAAAGPLPPKVLSVIQARLLGLAPASLELARVAAVIGRAFTVDILSQVSGTDEDTLVQALDELWQQQVVREQRVAHLSVERYDFTHDKIREVVYSGLSPIRRRFLHRRVAQGLETLHPHELDAVAHQIAAHYERAELLPPAISSYARAAHFAQRVSAQQEAMGYLRHALDLLGHLPANDERASQELALQSTLGPLLLATKGYAAPEVETAFRRAWTLSQQVGDQAQRFQSLWGLQRYYMVKPDLAQGVAAAEQLLALAQAAQDPHLLLEADCSLGAILFHCARLTEARHYLETCLALYDPQQHADHRLVYGQDPGVIAHSYLALTLWCLGDTAAALSHNQAAVELAQRVDHPYSLVTALTYATMQAHFLGAVVACRSQAESTMALAQRHEITLWLATNTFLRGWALTEQGDFEQGFADMQTSIDLYRNTGAELGVAYSAGLLAATFGRSGQPDVGLITLDGAFALLEGTQERWCEAELHRLRGELHLRLDDPTAAEASFQTALVVARSQQAKIWELRAALSLAQLWQQQGKGQKARDLLAALVAWFPAETPLPDLQAAQRLLASG